MQDISTTITPRFYETDALGHINNTRLPAWFENARDPIFRFFTPDLDLKNWPLILARMTVDFKKQLYLDAEVEVRSNISKIGNSSFSVHQEAWQNGVCAAIGVATMVHFDYRINNSVTIPDSIREKLQQHLVSS